MLTRPADLPDREVAEALSDGWGLDVERICYAPLGFGSHHWLALAGGVRWFVTVDDLDARRRDDRETRDDTWSRLTAALGAARALSDAGLDAVVAPTRCRSGALVQRVGPRYVVALYPYIEGRTHEWGPYPTTAERLAVLDRVVEVHAATPVAADHALVDDQVVPGRATLERLLSDPSVVWGPGPYAERARLLLDEHHDAVRAPLATYDALTIAVASRDGRRVLTHGEPHRANTIDTGEGVALIDWDTALIAPPERDLWALVAEDPSIAAEYTRRSGTVVDEAAIELYRLWWDLCEISLFAGLFNRPHRGTEDERVAWDGLTRYLDPARWSP